MFVGGNDLRDWVRSAAPGASLCLGVAEAVPAATQPALGSMLDAGLVDVARKRVAPGRYRFYVQRRSRRFIDSFSVTPRGGRHARRAGTVERRLLRILTAAATADLPCPTNAVLARALGLSGGAAASYRLRRLQQRGLVRVEVPADPRLLRVVIIVANGKATRRGLR